MSVPDFQSLMLPVLQQLAADGEQSPSDVRAAVASKLQLTPEDLAEMLPSGRQTTFANRVAWALGYLKQAGLLESPRRGSYRLVERGRSALTEGVDRIDIQYLMRFPEFAAFRRPSGGTSPTVGRTPQSEDIALTPDEQMRVGYARLRANVAAQLLERVQQVTPKFFEELVVDLLVAMGYGGSREDAAAVVGRSGDEGIDGIIKEDRLGLDAIYVQAKRWKETVGRPDIQRFAGALQGQRARKGVFITTSTFTAEAKAYANNLQSTIVLVDGNELAEFMLDHGVGVGEAETLKVLRLDEDYFSEDLGG
ncbi:MAG TPA: restriction endonuclease [Gemmatimonadota bacterium]|nr:restriction endonuclease [Gemmatimonadota bacterium]